MKMYTSKWSDKLVKSIFDKDGKTKIKPYSRHVTQYIKALNLSDKMKMDKIKKEGKDETH